MSDNRPRKVAQQISRDDEKRKRHPAKRNAYPSSPPDLDESCHFELRAQTAILPPWQGDWFPIARQRGKPFAQLV